MSTPTRQKPSLVLDDRLDANNRNKCKPRANQHRQNVDHLLGFQLPPRVAPPRRMISRNSTNNTRSPSYLRDRFIHAKYRFIMSPLGDYTAHFCDPDIHFHWPDVLQVLVASTATPAATLSAAAEQDNFCPICLNEPPAPRMTKCGHIFCYPCLLHLFGISDAGKWTKCPVCADTIHTKDLKSVRFTNTTETSEDLENGGDQVTLSLMQRPQYTTLALPRSATWPSEAVPHLATPWHFSPDAFTFARFMLATPEYMISALANDRRELDALSPPGAHDLEASFVDTARVKIHEQNLKAESLKTAAILAAKRQSQREINALAHPAVPSQPEASTSSSSGTSSCEDELQSQSQPLPRVPPSKPRKANVNPQPIDHAFYFYQASSGANIFLHPLDIKILKSHYASYADFPNTLRVTVEGREEGSANEDLRRRCRYLSHLPASSDVTFLEVEWESILPARALEAYASALKTRRNRRKERTKREDRAKARSEEKDRQKLVDDIFRHSAESRSAAVHPVSGSAQDSFDVRLLRARMHEVDNEETFSASPSSPSLLGTSLPSDPDRTVWGTRAAAAQPQMFGNSGEESEEGEVQWENAWADWETKSGLLPCGRHGLCLVLRERNQPRESSTPATSTPPSKSRKAKKITLTLGSGGRGRS